jgi:hypothetical protein
MEAITLGSNKKNDQFNCRYIEILTVTVSFLNVDDYSKWRSVVNDISIVFSGRLISNDKPHQDQLTSLTLNLADYYLRDQIQPTFYINRFYPDEKNTNRYNNLFYTFSVDLNYHNDTNINLTIACKKYP